MANKGNEPNRLKLLSPLPGGMGYYSCTCGTVVKKAVYNVSSGNTRSCGCLKKELMIARNRTHGMYGSREHGIWASMIQRCTNPRTNSYQYYGARGVSVCPEWERSFEKFFEDMGEAPTPDHSIDRIDVKGPYCKSNCRWATEKEQQTNRSNNLWLTLDGRSMSMKDWAVEVGIDYHALYYRHRAGWSVRDILTTPSQAGVGSKETA